MSSATWHTSRESGWFHLFNTRVTVRYTRASRAPFRASGQCFLPIIDADGVLEDHLIKACPLQQTAKTNASCRCWKTRSQTGWTSKMGGFLLLAGFPDNKHKTWEPRSTKKNTHPPTHARTHARTRASGRAGARNCASAMGFTKSVRFSTRPKDLRCSVVKRHASTQRSPQNVAGGVGGGGGGVWAWLTFRTWSLTCAVIWGEFLKQMARDPNSTWLQITNMSQSKGRPGRPAYFWFRFEPTPNPKKHARAILRNTCGERFLLLRT